MPATKKNICAAALTLLAIWLAAAALVGINGNFPLNDDWQYAYPVQQLVEKGRLEMQGYFAPNIILQVYWGYLFCWLAGSFDFAWLRLSTLTLALLGAWACYVLVRRLGIAPSLALLAAAILLFNPLYFSLSFSFMTDVPFLAAILLALLAFERYIIHHQAGWLWAAGLLSVAAYLIRQPGLVLLPAFGLWRAIEEKGSRRSIAVALLAAGAAIAVYLIYERLAKPWLGISGNFVPVSNMYLDTILSAPLAYAAELLRKGLKTWIYLGFFGLPLLPFLGAAFRQSGLWQKSTAIPLISANLALFAFLCYIDKLFPFGGNILYNLGLGPELLADTYTLGLANTPRLPAAAMYAFTLLSQLAATALLWVAIRGWKQLLPGQQRFFNFLLLTNLLYLPAMSITSFFDRYILLCIVSMLLLLLPHARMPQLRLSALAPFILYALFSFLATRDYLDWNRARFKAYTWLHQEGIGIEQADAGYEYNGFYNYQPERSEIPGRSHWWVTDDTWMITFGPVPGYEKAKAFTYRRWLWGGRQDEIWVVARAGLREKH
jgi:hypothetical protein